VTVPRSWNLPSPILFTASDPHAADGKAGVATILQVVSTPGVRPTWGTPDGKGRVYQAEGNDQATEALAQIEAESFHGDRAVVTNGLDAPVVAEFTALGVTSWMVECYAQAGDQPYGMIGEMIQNARAHGMPRVIPTLGVYDNISLQHYLDLNGAGHFRHGHWNGGPLAIYLAEGMGDTGSWPTLATL
jgi:hypothetical protein